jgi:hypothetical protein
MLQMNTIQSVFDETGFTNSEQDVFDIAVISRNNWFLYGATKPDKAWYSVNSIYEVPTDLDLSALGEDTRRDTIDKAMTEADLSHYTEWDYTKLFSIRIGHENVTPIKVIDDRMFEWEALYSKWSGGKNISACATPVALEVSYPEETTPDEDKSLTNPIEVANNNVEPKPIKNGFVYCLTNSLMPGICKVGFTTRSPYDRLKELCGTNLPEDWEVEWAYPFSNPNNIEKSIHKDMNKYRIRSDREFFKLASKDVYKILFEKYVNAAV